MDFLVSETEATYYFPKVELLLKAAPTNNAGPHTVDTTPNISYRIYDLVELLSDSSLEKVSTGERKYCCSKCRNKFK